MKKNKTPAAQEEAAMQLFRYFKHILAEQLDRRFVIGLTLCGSLSSAYLCDRSGILGMDQPIDIHVVSLGSS